MEEVCAELGSSNEHTPVCIRKRDYLVGEVLTRGAYRAVAVEICFLEFPFAIRAQPQTRADFRIVHFRKILQNAPDT